MSILMHKDVRRRGLVEFVSVLPRAEEFVSVLPRAEAFVSVLLSQLSFGRRQG
uniref:Ornithine decarboxylase n=1 Tax=Heterorhabditis bacteriophora TaxID=37862 RepID=A0A1I7X833_HETBA